MGPPHALPRGLLAQDGAGEQRVPREKPRQAGRGQRQRLWSQCHHPAAAEGREGRRQSSEVSGAPSRRQRARGAAGGRRATVGGRRRREGQWAPRQDSLLPGRPRAGVPGGRALRVPYEVSFSPHIEPVSSGRELGSQQPNVSRSEVCRSQTPLPVTSLGVLHDSPSSSSRRHTRGPRELQGGGVLGTGVTPGGEAMTGIAVRALRKREVNVPRVDDPLGPRGWSVTVVSLAVSVYEFQITFPFAGSSVLYKNSGWQSGNGSVQVTTLVLA